MQTLVVDVIFVWKGLLLVLLNKLVSAIFRGANQGLHSLKTVVIIVFSKNLWSFDPFVWFLTVGLFRIWSYTHWMDYTLVFFFVQFIWFVKMFIMQCFKTEIDEKLHQKNYLSIQNYQTLLDKYEHQNCLEKISWNLQWSFNNLYQKRTSWKIDFSNFSRRCTFNCFSMFICGFEIKRSWFCLRLETSTSILLQFFANFFNDQRLVWANFIISLMNRSIGSDCLCTHNGRRFRMRKSVSVYLE